MSSARGLSPHFLFDLAAVAACVLWVRQVESEHIAHQHHIMEENGGKLPEPPAYEYLNRRGTYLPVPPCYAELTLDDSVPSAGGPFPWGNNTLFFNPKVCSLPFLQVSSSDQFIGEQGYGGCFRVEYLTSSLVLRNKLPPAVMMNDFENVPWTKRIYYKQTTTEWKLGSRVPSKSRAQCPAVISGHININTTSTS